MSLLRRQVSTDSFPSLPDDDKEPLLDDIYDDPFEGGAFISDIDDDPPVYRSEPSVVGTPLLPHLSNTVKVVPNTPSTSSSRPGRYPGIDICIVCQQKPPFTKDGKSYPTCGLTCAGMLRVALNTSGSTSSATPKQTPKRKWLPNSVRLPRSPSNAVPTVPIENPCVVCHNKPCHGDYVTCGLQCAEILCSKGSSDAKMCTYCHRRPKLSGHNQCGKTCADAAKLACLLCKSRPKFKHYQLCGKSCKQISAKSTPLLLEAPEGHATWDHVQKKFETAWKFGTRPTIKKIYKIIESKNFLQPYEQYKKRVGRRTEVFCYHGTHRKCTVGSSGNTKLCNDNTCALCSILKSSFKTSFSNPSGAFGAGIYSSSAANKAYNYTRNGTGALILSKVVLGNVYNVTAFAQVSSCPTNFNSVVFDRQNGSLNETIVYSDDAIRPVFLLIFK